MKVFKVAVVLSLFSISCASNPHKARLLDDEIDNRTHAANRVDVGLKNGEMISQTKVYLAEELRSAENSAYELEARVYGGHRYLDNDGLYGVLKSCYVSQAKLTGNLTPMSEDRAYIIPTEEHELGVDKEKNLVGLRNEYLKDRLARFKQYKEVLLKRQTEYENKIDLCKLKVGSNL